MLQKMYFEILYYLCLCLQQRIKVMTYIQVNVVGQKSVFFHFHMIGKSFHMDYVLDVYKESFRQY